MYQTGRIFYYTDRDVTIHAIKLILWDKECAYSIMGMREKIFNTSVCNEFLI